MKVHHPSHISGVDLPQDHVTRRAHAESKGSGVSFAEQLAGASKSKKTHKAHNTEPAQSTAPPKGEKTQAVTGHPEYQDIVAGPRNGMYLNTSGNVRNGQAFVMVKRHGTEYHIYGTGKDRHVIVVRHHKTPPASTAPTTTTTPATTPGAGTPTSGGS
jgi:hypothetical protein